MSEGSYFDDLDFEGFRSLALDKGLSKYEKIGFPDSYRAGFEASIMTDIQNKLSNLDRNGCRVIDIGPGCSDLPHMIIDLCRKRGHLLSLIDCQEMLDLLPDESFVEKVPALYPNCQDFINANVGKVDCLICYSVIHYIIIDAPFFRFIDSSLSLLSPGGQMLIGDIPNISKRKRFFASETGSAFHRQFMQTDEAPNVVFNCIEPDKIDDAVIMALLMRARVQGYDAYVLPQASNLPMANRREDILIVRP